MVARGSHRSPWRAAGCTLTGMVALCSCVRDSDNTPDQAPREYCVELRAALEDVASGKSAWRCPKFNLDLAVVDSAGTNEDICARWTEGPCVGAPPAEGTFACGPKDCAKGTACRDASECDGSQNSSCFEPAEPCSAQNCGCADAVCGSTAHSSCSTGVEGDLWVQCSEYLTCGS